MLEAVEKEQTDNDVPALGSKSKIAHLVLVFLPVLDVVDWALRDVRNQKSKDSVHQFKEEANHHHPSELPDRRKD